MKINKKTLYVHIIAFIIGIQVGNCQSNPNPNSSLDAFILDEMNLEKLPGVSTVIVKDNKIVWMKSYGFADVQNGVSVKDSTVFLLASISKVFTGTAAMQLVENNLISLDDDVNQFLPWEFKNPNFPSIPITFRQLMAHTASIQDNNSVMDNYYDNPDPSISLANCMERYFSPNGADYNPTANFLSTAPGTSYEYSNMGTALNGYLVEVISETPFDQFTKTNIFNKLCMENTSWFFSDLDSANVARPYQFVGNSYQPYAHYGFADYPDGQLRSNSKDMANFMIAYLNQGTFGNSSILTHSSIQQMWTTQFPSIDAYQGLNWYQEELYHNGGTSWLWGHNGGEKGASTDMYLDPVNKIGICVLTNGEGDGIYICEELYNYALSLNANTGYSPTCLTANINTITPILSDKKLVKIIDFLGRETILSPNTPLIKLYEDGSTEKIFIQE
jgi:CubicO group peptidase (beta-lactamase class C family)